MTDNPSGAAHQGRSMTTDSTTTPAEPPKCEGACTECMTEKPFANFQRAWRVAAEGNDAAQARAEASAPQVVEPSIRSRAEALGMALQQSAEGSKVHIAKVWALLDEVHALYEASAPSVQVVEPRDEAAWLIELRPDAGITLWWDGTFQRGTGMFDKPTLTAGMTNDANQAARFAMRESAQKVLDGFLAMRPFCVFANAASLYSVTEHLWPAQASALPAATNPWRQALDDKLVNVGLDCLGPDETPQQAIKRLIEWETTTALDPAVSAQAQALIERGRAQPAAAQPAGQHNLTARIEAYLDRVLPATQQPAVEPVAWVGAEAVEQLRRGRDVHSARLWAKPHPADVPLYASPTAQPAAPDVVADARRYRWLRAEDLGTPEDQGEIYVVRERAPFTEGSSQALFGEELDAAIDAELDREGQKP